MLAPGAGRWFGPPLAVAVFFGVLAALGGLAGPTGWAVAAVALLATGAVVFLLVFFRDPERVPGEGIVSAADGRIHAVERDGSRVTISVFMNVGNVHVNRWPVDGTVEEVTEGGRGFRPAYRPDASGNVQRRYRLATALGPVEVVQITGILARRLVSFVRPGLPARKGDRFGMIVLGSRVDVVLPADRVRVTVQVGDRVEAGTTSIARERT